MSQSDHPDQGDVREKLGDICHEHYLGCSQNPSAPNGFEYAYDNEVVNLLDLPEARAAIATAIKDSNKILLTKIEDRLQAGRNAAERRGKEMTIKNRAKYARDNETLGESHSRNQGFKSGLIVAQKAIYAELAALTTKEES